MSQMQSLYVGSAGQALVKSAFLIRGYNVAVPEVDRGDDLFVVHDIDGGYYRIQVKTALAKDKGTYHQAQFSLRIDQLEEPQTPDLTYVFVTRFVDESWADFIVIHRASLYELLFEGERPRKRPPKGSGKFSLGLSFRNGSIFCGKESLQWCRNNFSSWPALEH